MDLKTSGVGPPMSTSYACLHTAFIASSVPNACSGCTLIVRTVQSISSSLNKAGEWKEIIIRSDVASNLYDKRLPPHRGTELPTAEAGGGEGSFPHVYTGT